MAGTIFDNDCRALIWKAIWFREISWSLQRQSFHVNKLRIVKPWCAKPWAIKALRDPRGSDQEDNVFPMVPAGKSAFHMIVEKPTTKMEKPTGST